jgi:hypothetical protein
MRTLQRCAHCGFEIGEDGHSCRAEPQLSPEARRAARQIAGLDLPTRAVYELPQAGSRREPRPARPGRRPSWASDLIAFATVLALAALVALGLERVARMERFAIQLPGDTAAVLSRAATGLAIAAAVTAGLALVAFVARAISRRRHRVIVLP